MHAVNARQKNKTDSFLDQTFACKASNSVTVLTISATHHEQTRSRLDSIYTCKWFLCRPAKIMTSKISRIRIPTSICQPDEGVV